MPNEASMTRLNGAMACATGALSKNNIRVEFFDNFADSLDGFGFVAFIDHNFSCFCTVGSRNVVLVVFLNDAYFNVGNGVVKVRFEPTLLNFHVQPHGL